MIRSRLGKLKQHLVSHGDDRLANSLALEQDVEAMYKKLEKGVKRGATVKLSDKTIEVNDHYKAAYTYYESANVLMVYAIGLMIILASFMVFMIRRREWAEEQFASISTFGFLMKWPFVFFSVVMLSCCVLFVINEKKTNALWMSSALVAILLVGFFFLLQFLVSDKAVVGGSWSGAPLNVSASDIASLSQNQIWLYMCLIVLVCAAVSAMRGSLRLDRFSMTDPSFLALGATVFVVAFVSLHISVLALRTARNTLDTSTGLNDTIWGTLYTAILFGVLVLLLAAMRFGDYLVEMYFHASRKDETPSKTLRDLAQYSASKTKKVILALSMLAIVIPAMLIWKVRHQMTKEDASTLPSDWRSIFSLLMLAMFMIPLMGLLGTETEVIVTPLFNVISNFIIGVLFFVIGVAGVLWTPVTAVAFVVFWLFVVTAFATNSSSRRSSQVMTAWFFTGAFLIARYASKLLLNYLESSSSSSDSPNSLRLIVYLVPALFVGTFWLLKSYIDESSYTPSILFTLFYGFYVLTIFWEDSNKLKAIEPVLSPGASLESNYGIEFFLVFLTVLVILSMGELIRKLTVFIATQLSGGDTPLAQTSFTLVGAVGVAYIGAYTYHMLLKSKALRDFIKASQDNVKDPYKYFVDDLKAAADWKAIKDTLQ